MESEKTSSKQPSRGSKEVRKPWGGQLTPVAADGPDFAQRSFAAVAAHLSKFSELCLLATIVAVPLTYHFSLPPEMLIAIRDFVLGVNQGAGVYFFPEQLQPWLTGSMPTLESKFSAWFILGSMMIAGYVASRFLEGLADRDVLPDVGAEMASSRGSRYRFIPFLCLMGFVVYALASLLFWPPRMPAEAREILGRMPGEDADFMTRLAASLGGGGFYYSMVAWLQVLFGAVFFLACEDLIRRRRLVYKVLTLLVICGVANALVVILQKLEFGPLMSVWIRFGETDTRNKLGAFIGHNTGVSSYLVAPFFIALTWLITRQPSGNPIVRVALGTGVLMLAMALILAQSRAIVPVMIFFSILLVVMLYRKSCLPAHSRLYVWLPVALVALVLTQLVPHSLNPLYRRDVTLVERVGEFRPQRVLTETRLRITAVSLTELVPQSPVLGHGFASFQYVYPRAQGRYFEENPRSMLAPTGLRTQRGHNEYLQVLIETGAVGLGLVAVGLFFLLRGGWIVFQRTLLPNHIAIQAAIWCSICTLLVHCAVDFPMRVPPLALTIVVLLAVWSAGDRLWIFPMSPPVSEDQPATPEGEAESSGGTMPLRPWAAPVGVLALLALLGGCVALSMTTINRHQSAATFTSRGESFILSYRDNPTQEAFLVEAWDLVYAARRVLWISGPVNRLNSQVQFLRAAHFYRQADARAQMEEYEVAARTRAYAESLAKTAITDLHMALAEEYFHSIFRLRSDIHRLIAANSMDEERRFHFQEMRDDLYRAVSINPGDPTTVLALVNVLESDPVMNASDIARYLSLLHHFHRPFFQEQVFGRVLDALFVGAVEEANTRMNTIVEAIPENREYYQILASTELAAGNLDRAAAIAASILEADEANTFSDVARDNARMVLAQVAAREGDAQRAIEFLDRTTSSDVAFTMIETAMRLYLVQDESRREILREEILAEGRRSAMAYQLAGVVAFEQFRNYPEAIRWLEMRRGLQPPMDLQGYLILARAYAETGRWAELRDALQRMRELSRAPYVRQLSERLIMELESRIPAEQES